MRIAALTLKPWPLSHAVATLVAALVVVALVTTLLAGAFRPSAVAGGTTGALVLIYLGASGNSVTKGPWSTRIAVVVAWLAYVLVSGVTATIVFGL